MAVLEKRMSTATESPTRTARRAGWAVVVGLAIALAVAIGALASSSEPLPQPVVEEGERPLTELEITQDLVNRGYLPAEALERPLTRVGINIGVIPPGSER